MKPVTIFKDVNGTLIPFLYQEKMGQNTVFANIRNNCDLTPIILLQMMKDYEKFLKEVEILNHKYASIYFNVELEALAMPFWTWQEIQKGLELRQEWEVDKELIPFYGDWHDLFCLNGTTGEIVALNDERDVLCKWASVKDFLRCLSETEIVYDEYLEGGVHHFGDSKGHEVKH